MSAVRDGARRLLGRSYVVSKQFALLRMRRRGFGDGPPMVVFSMGKAGSTAVARAVQDATSRPVFQVFRLEAERRAQAEGRYRAAASPPFPGAAHLWESEFLLRHPPSPAAPWTVITTVREPIAQAVSAFFHGRGRAGAATKDARTIDALNTQDWAEDWVRAPLRWFDREFMPALGIDVFQLHFDTDAGCAVIETPSARVLLLRQESFDVAPAALGSFLGLGRPVPVPARNEAASKAYAEGYRAFLASAHLPRPILDEAYGSRYARHFYADSEIERFRRRWAEGPDGAARPN